MTSQASDQRVLPQTDEDIEEMVVNGAIERAEADRLIAHRKREREAARDATMGFGGIPLIPPTPAQQLQQQAAADAAAAEEERQQNKGLIDMADSRVNAALRRGLGWGDKISVVAPIDPSDGVGSLTDGKISVRPPDPDAGETDWNAAQTTIEQYAPFHDTTAEFEENHGYLPKIPGMTGDSALEPAELNTKPPVVSEADKFDVVRRVCGHRVDA